MTGLGAIEIFYFILIVIALPLASMWLAVLTARLKKLTRRQQITLYVSSVAALLIAWPFSNVFVPLAFIGDFILVFVSTLFIAKLPRKKSLLLGLIYMVLHFLLTTVVSAIILTIAR